MLLRPTPQRFRLARIVVDVLIIGSGFGSSMAAWEFCRAGARVLMLERGGWVERGPENWHPDGAYSLTPHYDPDTSYEVRSGRRRTRQATCSCVGGPSVFYGGVAFRFRERDFEHDPAFTNGTKAEWPFRYRELEPWYALAERLLGVAGTTGEDPTEPPRSSPYPHALPPLAPASDHIAAAARSLGLHPSRLPLAIAYPERDDGTGCVGCITCDGFACAVGAKNDLATRILPRLVASGLELRASAVVTRLLVEGGRAVGVEYVDRVTGERREERASTVVLGAGAIASALLLLASGLDGGGTVGRYLMRHCSGIVYGVFPGRADWSLRFHKQLAITDFYFGGNGAHPPGRLGSIQQVMTPPLGLVRATLPRMLGGVAGRLVPIMTGLLVMAEDQPVSSNRVRLDPDRRDRFGMPTAIVEHRYTRRDLAARRALFRHARRILYAAGARAHVVHRIHTFSHAVGTVRFGDDPRTSALEPDGKVRGVEGLYVVDGSVMPTSAGVNPSLTIAALSLRTAAGLTGAPAPVSPDAP